MKTTPHKMMMTNRNMPPAPTVMAIMRLVLLESTAQTFVLCKAVFKAKVIHYTLFDAINCIFFFSAIPNDVFQTQHLAMW